jgi:hypothetical protein
MHEEDIAVAFQSSSSCSLCQFAASLLQLLTMPRMYVVDRS